MEKTNHNTLVSHVITNDYIEIIVDKPSELLMVTWKRQATSEELRRGFYMAIEVSILYNCKYWLSDARKTNYLEIADQHWMVRDLVQLLSETHICKVARLIKDDELSILSSYRMKEKIENDHKPLIKFSTEVFTDFNTARFWLLAV